MRKLLNATFGYALDWIFTSTNYLLAYDLDAA